MGDCNSRVQTSASKQISKQHKLNKYTTQQSKQDKQAAKQMKKTQNEVKQINCDAQPYFDALATFKDPYQNSKPLKGGYSQKNKQILINLQGNISIVSLDPKTPLNIARRQLNLTKSIRFQLMINKQKYLVETNSENQVKIKQIWEKIDKQYAINLHKHNIDPNSPQTYKTQADKNQQINYKTYIQNKRIKQIIMKRNENMFIAYLDTSKTLDIIRCILNIGSFQHFYQIKFGKQIPIEKSSQSKIRIKDILQKNQYKSLYFIINIYKKNIDNGQFIGEIIQEKRQGYGWFYYFNEKSGKKRKLYQGQWKNDCRCGQGTLYWDNGDKFIGQWLQNGKPGIGTIFMKNGEKYQGNFNQGIAFKKEQRLKLIFGNF